MMFYSHVMFSLFVGLFLIGSFVNKYLFLVLLVFGSLVPDLDNPYSKIGRKLRPFSNILRFFFGHRGMFHSILPAILIFAVFYYILGMELIGIALSVGFMLHLVLDGLTREGVNYFYPLKFRVSGFVKTGGIFEWIIF